VHLQMVKEGSSKHLSFYFWHSHLISFCLFRSMSSVADSKYLVTTLPLMMIMIACTI
jgi:hypothetical protein